MFSNIGNVTDLIYACDSFLYFTVPTIVLIFPFRMTYLFAFNFCISFRIICFDLGPRFPIPILILYLTNIPRPSIEFLTLVIT